MTYNAIELGLPILKSSELYARSPQTVSTDISHLWGCYYSHVPEIGQSIYAFKMDMNKNDRIEIVYYRDASIEARRIWTLAAIKFDDGFVMITQNAGREGDDHAKRFITDHDAYLKMVAYLRSLLIDAPIIEQEIFDIDADIEGLEQFYGNHLDGPFGRYG